MSLEYLCKKICPFIFRSFWRMGGGGEGRPIILFSRGVGESRLIKVFRWKLHCFLFVSYFFHLICLHNFSEIMRYIFRIFQRKILISFDSLTPLSNRITPPPPPRKNLSVKMPYFLIKKSLLFYKPDYILYIHIS